MGRTFNTLACVLGSLCLLILSYWYRRQFDSLVIPATFTPNLSTLNPYTGACDVTVQVRGLVPQVVTLPLAVVPYLTTWTCYYQPPFTQTLRLTAPVNYVPYALALVIVSCLVLGGCCAQLVATQFSRESAMATVHVDDSWVLYPLPNKQVIRLGAPRRAPGGPVPRNRQPPISLANDSSPAGSRMKIV